jgi:hypothetical protein
LPKYRFLPRSEKTIHFESINRRFSLVHQTSNIARNMSLSEKKAEEEEAEVDASDNQDKEKAREAKGVDSVTDYFEEKSNTDVSKAMSALESLEKKPEQAVDA